MPGLHPASLFLYLLDGSREGLALPGYRRRRSMNLRAVAAGPALKAPVSALRKVPPPLNPCAPG